MSAPAAWSSFHRTLVLPESVDGPGSSVESAGEALSLTEKNRAPCHMAMTCLLASFALRRSSVSHLACGPSAAQLMVVVVPPAQFSPMMCQLPMSVEYQPPSSAAVLPPLGAASGSRIGPQSWRSPALAADIFWP